MAHNEFVELVIERVASNAPNGSAFFYWDEVRQWPKAELEMLEKSKLLYQAQSMTEIECDGCEENCFMPVNILPISDTQPARAFITCDKRDDIGRVKVDFLRLKQWQLSAMQLAQLVGNLCGLSQDVIKDADFWRLGILQGKKHKSPLLMEFDNNRAILKIAGHSLDLLEVIFIDNNNGYHIDITKLKLLADSPTGLADDQESAEARQDRLLARRNELKTKEVRNFNATIAEEESMSLANVKKLIKAAEGRKKSQKNNQYMQLIIKE